MMIWSLLLHKAVIQSNTMILGTIIHFVTVQIMGAVEVNNLKKI